MGNTRALVSRSGVQSLAGVALLLGSLCAALNAEAKPPTVKEPHAASAQAFVQSFYDWYTAAI